MTKNKLVTKLFAKQAIAFLIMLVAAGVLSMWSANDAFAVRINKEAENDVKKFSTENMVQSEEFKQIGTDDEGKRKEAKDIITQFEGAIGSIMTQCGIYEQEAATLKSKNYVDWYVNVKNRCDAKSYIEDRDYVEKELEKLEGLAVVAKNAYKRGDCRIMQGSSMFGQASTTSCDDDIEVWEYKDCIGKDENGECIYKTYYFEVNKGGNRISSAGVTRGCEPLPLKLYEARSCLFCPLFDIILEAISDASKMAYAKLGRPLSTLVLMGMALWFAIKVLLQVSSMNKQDALPFLTDLFKGSFKVFIAFLLLRDAAVIYNLFLNPILKAGFDFGASFLQTNNGDIIKGCDAVKEFELKNVGGLISSDIYTNLLCYIESVQYELSKTQAIGSSLMCVSRNAAADDVAWMKNVLPDFSMMIQGFFIWFIGFMLSISFAFYLIDATIQLGIFGVVLPFLILCWPFKITNQYFKTGIGIFVNSWFIYVFMGIVTNITIALIGEGLTGGKSGMNGVMEAINGNDVKALQDLLEIGFTGFLILIACCIFAIKLMMKVTEIAGQFGGGGLGLGIGAKLGGLAASGVTNTAKFAGGKVAKWSNEVYNAQIWGKDGEEHSLKSSVDKVRHKIGRGGAKAVVGTARFAVGMVAHPVDTTKTAASAVKNSKAVKKSGEALKKMFNTIKRRRNPSA